MSGQQISRELSEVRDQLSEHTRTLGEHTGMLTEIRRGIDEMKSAQHEYIRRFGDEIKDIRNNEIKDIRNKAFDGNGQPSLLQRIVKIEHWRYYFAGLMVVLLPIGGYLLYKHI